MRLNLVEAGEGPPVALLHGLFGAAQNWGAIQKALAPHHRVLALDLRNHGASPHDAEMGYAAMAEDVAATLDAAGALPAAVVGHSMGGKAAMTLALARPDAVARLVVVDIAPVRYAPTLRGYVAAMQGLELRPGLTRREADAALATAVPEPAIRAFLLQNLRFPPAGSHEPPAWRLALDHIAAAMPVIEDAPPIPAGARYDGPVLVLGGERSPYIRPEHRSRFLELFPAARFAAVPNAGHWVHAENPQGFLAALRPFLDEL